MARHDVLLNSGRKNDQNANESFVVFFIYWLYSYFGTSNILDAIINLFCLRKVNFQPELKLRYELI